MLDFGRACRARFGARQSASLGGEWRRSLPVLEHGLRVDHQPVADEVQVVAGVTDTAGARQPHRVVDCPVDRLGIVPDRVERLEIRIRGRDDPHVLGSFGLTSGVLFVAVQPHVNHAPAQALPEVGSRCTSETDPTCPGPDVS